MTLNSVHSNIDNDFSVIDASGQRVWYIFCFYFRRLLTHEKLKN